MDKRYLGVFFRGMAMGAADIVPGVSGGTIALITGVYEELLNSLKSVTPRSLCLIWQDSPAAFWQAINGTFLISLLSGIVLSLISLSHLLTFLIAQYPILVWSFFFGLVAASGIWLLKQCSLNRYLSWVFLIVGTAVAWAITSGRPMEVEPTYLVLFFSGALAICAMILPGISGSFILLLLGVYAPVLAAIKGFDLGVITVFGLGCATGLLSFVHILSYLLKRFHAQVLALLTGFLFGSLNALWPWKQVLEFYTSSKGIQKPLLQVNVLPNDYLAISQQEPLLMMAIFCALAGMSVVLVLEFGSRKTEA